jgi:N-acetylmuramoyl-L-alanine amidase
MGKRLSLLIFFWLFVVASLWANASYETQIKAFDQNFARASGEEMLKMHHMLKNIYIQSIIQNDVSLKAQALERLVKSAQALNLDAKPYESELRTLQANNPSLVGPKDSSPKIEIKPIPKIEPIQKPTTPSQPKTPSPVSANNSAPLAALSVNFEGDGIQVRFNKPIASKDVKSFVLKSKNTIRYVFDIPGALMGNSRTYDSAIIDQVRVAQYDKDTIRVVFSNKNSLNLEYKIDNKMLHIGLSDTISNSTKPTNYTQKHTSATSKHFNPKDKVIVIDPGHGGKDPGAVNGKLKEKKAVLDVALKLGNELKKRGYKVFYTRSKDTYLQLRSRTRVANDKNADLFISIHANAAPSKSKYDSMHGLETFFLSPARSERSKNVAALENKSEVDEMNYFSKQTYLNFLNREKIIASNKFALDVHQGMFDSLKGHHKIHDGGVREAPFWVLVGAQMPSVLLEIGYITHPEEGKRLFNSNYQLRIANGVADGVDNYFQKNN